MGYMATRTICVASHTSSYGWSLRLWYNTVIVDYCQAQYFIANCSRPDQVVLVQSARYGRMTLGRCGTGGSTNVAGCSEDVLWYLDRRCSGRTHCKVYVADPVLHHLNPCASDYTAYLQAKYTCVSGRDS